jgi:hypothetical protein
MSSSKLRSVILLLVMNAIPLGCVSSPIASNILAVANPVPLISLNGAGNASISMQIDTASGFKTKATVAFGSSMVTYYAIDLIRDQAGSSLASADYTDATLTGASQIVKSVFLQGAAPGSSTNGSILQGATPNSVRFSNVVAGGYRVRVKASKFSGAAAVVAAADTVNKVDGFFTNSSNWAISTNVGQVTNGSSATVYSPSGTALTTAVNLIDGTGNTVDSTATVAAGAPAPGVTASNF